MVIAALIVFAALVAAWLLAPAEERRTAARTAVRPILAEAA